MAAPTTKKSDAVDVVPAWHPNLRNAAELPDTKVVRTAFFVNGAAMLVAISAALYFGYGDFKMEEAKVDEVSDFVASKPAISEILLRLGAITTKRIAFDGINIKDAGITIRATVKGAPDRASGDVSAYERQLRTDKVLGPMFRTVTLLNPTRDPKTNRLVIAIFCEFKKPAKTS
jgi:hypothetical protein